MVTIIANMIVTMIRKFTEGTHGFGFYSKTYFCVIESHIFWITAGGYGKLQSEQHRAGPIWA